MKNIIKARTEDSFKELDIEITVVSGVLTEIRCLSDNLKYYDKIEKIEIPSTCRSSSGRYEQIYVLGSDIFLSEKGMLKKGRKIATSRTKIGKLVLPKSIAFAQNKALSNANIDTIVWPESCCEIPEECFIGSSVKDIQGLENVNSIKSSAFERCNNLKTFKWPQNVKKVPTRCFLNCNELESIEGMENVEEIFSYAFYACSQLKTFYWPESCKSIPFCCFMGCTSLENVVVNSSIEAVFTDAFRDTVVKNLDLSKSPFCNIADQHILNNKSIQLPFYQY